MLPDLYPDFVSSLDLRKLLAEMTADKSKDILQWFKPQVMDLIDKHMRFSNGTLQHSEDNPD